MAEDFSKSRGVAPSAPDHRSAGPRGYGEPPNAAWRPGKTASPLTGERPDSRGSAPPPPPPRGYPAAVTGALGFPAGMAAGLAPLTHLMPPWPAARPPLYLLPGHPAAETELQQLERDRLLAQHRQQQQQSASRDAASREAAEKQQREAAEKQQREAERIRQQREELRQEEERKKQQQAVSQHFAESMRRMHQKSRLSSGVPPGGGVGLHPSAAAGRFADPRGPADIGSESERVIRDRIHRLYQSTEPAGGQKPEPPPPPHASQPPRPPYAPDFMAYYDRLGVQQAHAAKAAAAPPAAERRSPYLPQAPGQPVYKPQPQPPLGRSPAPPEARLPPPPPQRAAPPAHGGDRSSSPYLPPGPTQPVPHRPVYSPPVGTHLGVVSAGLPPPPAHANHVRRTATPPAHHQTLDLSVSSRSSAAAGAPAGVIASPKRPASTPVLNLGVSPAKRACPEPLLSADEPISLVANAAKQITTVNNVAVTAAMEAAAVSVSSSRETWSTPPPPASAPPPTTSASSASAPTSGTSSPAPAEPPAVSVKQEPSSETRSYPHKGKKAWLLRHAGGGDDSASSTAIPVTTPSVSVSSVTSISVNGTSSDPTLSNGGGVAPRVASPASVVKTEKPTTPPEAATVARASPAPRKTPSPAAAEAKTAAATEAVTKSEVKVEVKVKPLSAADVAVNGDGDSDSSASSVPAKRKATPRRKTPKKSDASVRDAKKAKISEGSDSDSEKASEDEARETRRPDNKSAKKRGRKTKEKPAKQAKRSSLAAKHPPPVEKKETPPKKSEAIKRQPISSLKKSGVSFLQDLFCCNLSSKLPKCRECRITQTQRNKKLSNIYCRFTAFRRLRYTKSGVLTVAGFCDPEQDADEDDKRLWMPADAEDDDDVSDSSPSSAASLQPDAARALLSQAGPQFCELTEDEQEAARCHLSGDKTIAWKRVVQGCREMCDVCETTLFNVHWVCGKCGFAVCIDCYRGRKEGTARMVSEPGRDRDKYQWMLCSSRQPHEQQRLMLTQIVAGDALGTLSRQLHDARLAAGLPLSCRCEAARRLQSSADAGELPNGARSKLEDYRPGEDGDNQGSPLTWLADVALSDSKKNSDVSNSESESDAERTDGDHSTLRKLLIRTSDAEEKPTKKERQKKPSPAGAALATLDAVLDKVSSQAGEPVPPPDPRRQLKHYTRRGGARRGGPRDRAPPRVMTLADSQRLYPGVRHGWLCEGRLLWLQEEAVPAAVRLFRDQWARGQPVLFSGVGSAMDKTMWTPDAFTRDFGDERAELVDSVSGEAVTGHTHRMFWEGFSSVEKRPRDEAGRRQALVLRDWPPGEDFPDIMPARFNDLTTALPFAEYTRRDGKINLASCLPDTFVRPDLGPRLNMGYGGDAESGGAVTHLQQEVADSINILSHVCKAEGETDAEARLKAALEEAGCDPLTLRRATEEVPGAVWHIYQASDADCIRDLLNKVSGERGSPVDAQSDPLRQPSSWYLDSALRRRLQDEYGVQGYTVVQCAGDAVLVPAGAPHQVRHLHSCVRVAEDFVSPENVGNSFDVTQHLRALSQPGDSHEDKLQIKNIVYHAVKDAVGCLLRARRAGKASTPTASSPAGSA